MYTTNLPGPVLFQVDSLFPILLVFFLITFVNILSYWKNWLKEYIYIGNMCRRVKKFCCKYVECTEHIGHELRNDRAVKIYICYKTFMSSLTESYFSFLLLILGTFIPMVWTGMTTKLSLVEFRIDIFSYSLFFSYCSIWIIIY